jgi:hypothetical protein
MKKIIAFSERLSHSQQKQVSGGTAAPTAGLYWCPTTNRCYSRSFCASLCKLPCQYVGSSCPWD